MIQKLLTIVILAQLIIHAQTEQKISDRLQAKLMDNSSPVINVLVTMENKIEDLAFARRNPQLYISERSLARRKKVLPENALIEYSDLPVNNDNVKAIERIGGKIRHKLRWLNMISVSIEKNKVAALASLQCVKSIDILTSYRAVTPIQAEKERVNSAYKPQSILAFDYGDSYPQVNQIGIPSLHNQGFNGQNIIVAVLDAGFNNLAHEVFAGMQIIAKYDFVNHDPGVGDSTDLGSGSHGTATLSAIGGFKEGKLIGPAFGAKYILCKTENTYSETPVEEDNWIAAMQWADSIGADISSTSLGYIGFDAPYPSYTWQSMDGNTCRITIAADLAVRKGIAIFNSAGNEGFHQTQNTLGAPADGDSVIAVGAVNFSGVRTGFSSVGNTIDGRIKPDIMAMGSAVTLASSAGPTAYYQGSGTSYSCPLAAGAAAVILSARPGLTPMQLCDALRSTANNSSSPNREYGWGIINSVAALNSLPLPVELTSFSGVCEANIIKLKWSTATEKNNRGFTIELSENALDWQEIGFVSGHGSSAIQHNYVYSYQCAKTQSVYYLRLKQIDLDGSSNYSNTIAIENSPATFTLSQNYPNPFNPITRIEFYNPLTAKITLTVYDILGNKVRMLIDNVLDAGKHSVELNASGLSSGMYIYEIRSNGIIKRNKMTLLK